MSLLEPLLSPRVGQLLNFVGMLLSGVAALLSATVTSVGGSVPMMVLAPLVAIGFGVRLGGLTAAASRGEWSMGWSPRVVSWGFFGAAAALLGSAGSLTTVAVFGAFVVLDAVGGFVKRETRAPQPSRRKFPLKRFLTWAGLVAYLGLVAAFHVLLGQYLPYGVLVTWTLLALAFSFSLFVAVRGPKAGEAWLRAPADHKRHERREERVPDPHRQRAEDALKAFRARGDAAPLLGMVREAAEAADLRAEDVATLEERVVAAFGRAGTRREEDVRAALDEIEQFLSPTRKGLEATT